jgi:hypothetical protein
MTGQLPKQVTSIRYFPRASFAGRMLNGVFQGSNTNDFSVAVNLYTITSTPPAGVYTTQAITVTNAFSYVRYLAPTNGSGNVAELEFYGIDLANSNAPAMPTNLTASAGDRQVTLTWASVSNAASYKIKRGATNAVGPFSLIATGLTPTAYTDTNVVNGTVYYYRVVGTNANGDGPDSSSTIAAPQSGAAFGVYRQLWTGLSSTPGNSLAALTNTTYNPNWPNNPNAAYTRVYTNFETEPSTGMSLYGQRLRAFVVPPTNGAYTFWIATDDSSELFLSTDENPTNVSYLANVNVFSLSRQWNTEANQQSAPILLQGGRRYYIEAQHQQGNGGDCFAVRWQLPGGIIEEPMTAVSSNGTLLIPYIGTDTKPGIYRQATNVTVVEGLNASLSVVSTNQSSLAYQWRVNNTNLPGATTSGLLSVSNVTLAMTGQAYRCVLSNSAGAVTSAPITLSVLADTNPPIVTLALNSGITNVVVVFSEPVEIASATNIANYVFTNALPISRAAISPDGFAVTLTCALLVYGSNYSITINGIRDRASNPNTIAPNTRVAFVASPYVSQDIGNSAIASTTTFLTNGLNVTAAGSEIGTSSDQFAFNYLLRAGDFDVRVRLAGLTPNDVWAKAALMARETLDAGARFAASVTTPAMNGSFFEYRDPANSAAISTGNFSANYPNTWLRLQRIGNTFTGYAGYDGQSWIQVGSVTITMPSQVYLGLAVSSHSASQTTVAQFRDFGDATGATIATLVNPHEPSGPSSRKTPIAITEIMYKPAARADTNNLEFIEIYNSLPWFHDISGYQLVCADMSYTFPNNTIIAGGSYLVIAASPTSIQNVYGITNVVGPYAGSLKKSETLQLIDEQGAVLLTVPYDNASPWPVAADGTGHSIVLAYPTLGEGDPRAWDISDSFGGSPGQMDPFTPSPLRNVVINEFLAHTDPPDYDYIELYNHSSLPVDVSGCTLSDHPTTNKFVIPPSTIIPARGFIFYSETNMNFRLSADGEGIYFKNPTQTRILDAVKFGAQQNGVATGRWPDGADQYYRLAAKTPGASNAPIRLSDVVINELMYDPISGNDDDQYVELYNRSTNMVNLGGWTLNDAVSFTFPSNTVLVPDSYLVVARNAAHLRANYANLNFTNCLGDFNGKLSHNGERLALTIPDTTVSTNGQGFSVTNLVHITINDVTYGSGGRWGQWSAGGGSSLELIDPNSNTRLAANWRDSDETQKSAWTNIEVTAVLDNGSNYDAYIDYAQIGLLDVGECLVDNVEVRDAGDVNYVANSDFESGTNNWYFQGCHVRSSLENSGYSSGHSLHIRCGDRFFNGINSCQVFLNTNTLAAGQTATLRFKARWLCGWPEVLLRIHGNWLEATGPMPVPVNLGTPGLRNSRYVTNAGPAIYSVTHAPALPAAGQAAVVTARVHDSDGVQSLTLNYRLDPGTSYTTVTMTDDGTGGDALAGDGNFSATIPGQNAGTIAAFYVSATDTKGATTRFPALLSDNSPVRECLLMFGDGNPNGSFAVYHLWITQTNATRWAQLSDLSNESHDCTFVSGNRVIYNTQARFAGSPYHQGFDTPYGTLCHYKWIFPDDDKLFGATSFNKIHQPGNGAGDDSSLQREQTANMLLRALRVPWLYRKHVAVYVNGNRRGSLMEDAQTPDGDMVNEYFPNDTGGWLYKMQPWFEFAPFPGANSLAFVNDSWCDILSHTTTGGAKKAARYRFMFESRRTPDSANNFAVVYSIAEAATSFGTPNYVASVQNLADMENWMRVFAANHAAANRDSYGATTAQNLYGYLGANGTKYSLMMFDFNICLDHGAWSPGANLFSVYAPDTNTANFFVEPTFRRMYWRALEELVNGPLDTSISGPLIDAKYSSFLANGINAENPAAMKTWMSQAHDSIASQIAAENATGFAVNSAVVSNDVALVSGVAPVNVNTVWFNGIEYPITWISVSNWTAVVPLQPGTNQFSVVGADIHGQPISGDSANLSVVYNGTLPSPVGQVVINEIMANPATTNAQFVELYNNSTNITFDLSGWDFHGLSYNFPAGSIIGPNSFLVLTANRAAFASAYGATTPPFDAFDGTLQPDGETLSLVKPGTNSASDLTVSKVRYSSALPWPATTNGTSLQLTDPRQDNWREGNWSAWPATPGATNAGLAALSAFPPLWLNELQADNLTGITNSAGQRTPWLELYNPSTNSVALSNLYLTATYTNLAKWAFPSNAVINPRQFKVIFADGLTNLSTTNELHTSFTLPSGSGSLALSRMYVSQPQVLDYVDYVGVTANRSYGSFPDGQSFDRQQFVYVTPGGTNNATSPPLTVAINEWMAGNTHTLQDPLDGNKYDDWFELYNYGTNTVDLSGYYLTDTVSNQFKSLIPSGYTIPPHGFLLVWADNKSTSGTPDLHVSFKMSKSGEALGLYGSDGNPVDFVTYGVQTDDVSEGRYPDGSANLRFMTTATPRTNNIVPNTAPTLAVITNRSATIGQTLSFFASATDMDSPPQILTFSLGPGGPSGASINPSSGFFSWTPPTAPATNSISVIVTDNGGPSLSATQSFTVIVYPRPTVSAQISGGQLQLTWPRGTLQQADNVTGPYSDVPNATSPYTISHTGIRKFFRTRI